MPEIAFKIGSVTLPHRLILAPMCGITLKPFRQICKENGAGLVFNQMVSAKALTMKDHKSLKMLEFEESERPIGLQLFGNNADTIAEAARIAESTGADIIDLNLGCPAKKIVNDGGGSALLTDEVELATILRKMRRAINCAFTVKIRAGWDENQKNGLNVLKIAEDCGVDALAVHARTRAQGYSGHADWSFIKHLKENATIPIIGNGDVKTAADAHRMLKETGCDGVMTGRGAFELPWIFNDFILNTETVLTREKLKEMILKQYDYFMTYFGAAGGIKMMRKFLCAYTKGTHGGAAFRNEVVRLDDFMVIKSKINTFFNESHPERSEGSPDNPGDSSLRSE